MELEKAKTILRKLNDGYSFKDCEVCGNWNETSCQCDKKKCDYLIAIETVLADNEKKDQVIDEMAIQLAGLTIWDNEKKRTNNF